MHLIEQYALSCGCKISQPHLNPHFYPVPFNKYIVIHASSGMESKNYDFYNEVIELLAPIVNKNDIHFVQIGGEKDKKINNCHYALGTTKLQMQGIINNSILLLSNDTCSIHFASGLQKKIVTLYSTLYPSNASPYWSKPEDIVLLESSRNGQKPSFSANENPKNINLIKPEEVAKSILKLLNLNSKVDRETIYIGSQYLNTVLEIVPNFFAPNILNQNIIIRLDYINLQDKTQEILFQWSKNNNLNLICDKFFDLNLILPFYKKVASITFEIKQGYNIQEYENLFSSIVKTGIDLKLYSRDRKNISKIRLDFFDYIIDLLENIENPLDLNLKLDKLHTKTNKYLFSEGKRFLSKAHLFANISIEMNDCPLDKIDFWNEVKCFYIYK